MKQAMTAVAAVLVLGLGATAADAQRAGQKGRTAYENTDEQQQTGAAKITLGGRELTISADAVKPVQELIAAVNAKDVANIPAKLAAAKAVAKSADEKYLVAQLQLNAAATSKDNAALAQALEAMIASGGLPQAEVAPTYVKLAKIHYAAKQWAPAAAAIQQALQANPNDSEAMILLAETMNAQGKTNEAVAQLQKAILTSAAGGAKPSQDIYKRAVALAYEAKLPSAVALSRDWVAAYPTTDNWRDALRVYRNIYDLDDATTLDTLRLERLVGALAGESDFHRYAYLATGTGFPSEAKAVLDEGFAANKIDRNKQLFQQITKEVNAKAAGERAKADAEAKAALAAPAASKTVAAGDLLYGLGEYAKAADLYRAALGKSGANKDVINFRLGLSLAQAGDKAGATAALNAVGGSRAELAKYALVYVNSRG